jgi:hypothetical protein
VIVAAFVWFFYSGDGNVIEGARNTLDQLQGRGARVGHNPADDTTGVVDVAPDELASDAGVQLDTYAAARMIASEEPHSSRATKIAVCWCLINEANAQGISVARLLLRAKNPDHDGLFGAQADLESWVTNKAGERVHPSDRYASTRTDPFDEELLVAAACLDGSQPDTTGGARRYDRPAHEDAVRVANNRTAEGFRVVEVPGADPGLRFWA